MGEARRVQRTERTDRNAIAELTCTDPPTPQALGHSRRRTVLVLQGGGALGSYQAGAYEALAEGGLSLDWVAGVSIGAVNAAIIAGNPPERRVAHLRAFWQIITASSASWWDLPYEGWRALHRQGAAMAALLFGQPGFFRPRPLNAWLGGQPPLSYYDTSELAQTLARLIDFDRINHPASTRLSVGAVNVETGNMIYFDSRKQRIGPEHIMASGALPPGLASVAIDGAHYWDGGLVSNTPLQYVMDFEPREDMLVFQIDLYPARGKLPENLDEVAERAKDIRYSSRTRSGTDNARVRQELRGRLFTFLDRLPQELREDPVAEQLRALACPKMVDIVHLIYRPATAQGSAKDYEFSRATMERRWRQGRDNALATLAAAPWQAEIVAGEPVRVFDVLATVQR
ncbi:MAG TPA: patatin-like phospholipase family protein [Acetobacteraceae bacterium]|nr:patatin-like phospholipase family protein [Acetobacteraceae bacterium]